MSMNRAILIEQETSRSTMRTRVNNRLPASESLSCRASKLRLISTDLHFYRGIRRPIIHRFHFNLKRVCWLKLISSPATALNLFSRAPPLTQANAVRFYLSRANSSASRCSRAPNLFTSTRASDETPGVSGIKPYRGGSSQLQTVS